MNKPKSIITHYRTVTRDIPNKLVLTGKIEYKKKEVAGFLPEDSSGCKSEFLVLNFCLCAFNLCLGGKMHL